MMQKTIHILIIISLAMIFQACEKENLPPSCQVLNLAELQEIEQGSTLTISADAEDVDGSIAEVRFVINAVTMATVKSFPYNYQWTVNLPLGIHSISVIATDNMGVSSSDKLTIKVIEASPKHDGDDMKTDFSPPIDIILSDTVFTDTYNPSVFVATISTEDNVSCSYFTYELENTKDRWNFEIRDNKLYTSFRYYFETRTEFTIRIKSIDCAGNSLSKDFNIYVERPYLKANRNGGREDWIQIKNSPEEVPDNFEASFQIMVGEDVLSFFIKTQDNTFDTTKVFSVADKIDLYLAMDRTVNDDTSMGSGDYHVQFTRMKSSDLLLNHIGGISANRFSEWFIEESYPKMEFNNSETGYNFEFYLPLRQLYEDVGYSQYIKLDIVVTNYDEEGNAFYKIWNANEPYESFDKSKMGGVFLPSGIVQ